MIKTLYDKFKPWSEKGSIWIISDPHFEDSDCKLMNSNWVTPQEQVDIINKKVMPSDTLVILGDIGNPIWMEKIRSRNKILIMGNHDVSRTKFEPYFNEIYEGALFIAEKILLSHEPIMNCGWLNIHGHCHNGAYLEIREDGAIGINLAANVINYIPINLNKNIIKVGYLNKITSIHRQTINTARDNKYN